MSSIDPAKLKVVELRAELSTRGLDTKGNKPVLVKRLKEALEEELKEDLPDTSIADTSTEEINTSQESVLEDVQSVPPDKNDKPITVAPAAEVKESETPKPSVILEKLNLEQTPREQFSAVQSELKSAQHEPEIVEKQNENKIEIDDDDDDDEEVTETPKVKEGSEVEEVAAEDEEMPLRTSSEENGEDVDQEVAEAKVAEKEKLGDENTEETKSSLPAGVEQHKGEKRRRTSPSPDRSQRRRSKTPIKEDEPALDNNKVQLSWYDSDLHLQVDKKSFLSGKPYHEGAFGYAWAGVRATHGIKTGKVCYEVKITEELKWNDLVRQTDRRRDSYSRGDSSTRRERYNSRTEREDSKTEREDSKTEREDSKTDQDSSKTDQENTKTDQEDSKPEQEISETDQEATKIDQENPKTDQESSKSDHEDSKTDDKDENAESEEPKKEEEKPENDAKVQDATESKEKSEEAMEVEESSSPVTTEPIARHLFRVGWSTPDSNLQLGEVPHSFGFESSGKFVINKEFTDYGVKFGIGDVIGAYINVDEETVTVTYTVNGVSQPIAACILKSDFPEDVALFPHILTRNYVFELNLGGREEPWFEHPPNLEDYVYIEEVEDKVLGPQRPEARSECEVIMMCGLPGAGKTHWVRQTVQENPDKRYTVIGNSHLLERMTVNGNPLKNCYKGSWNVILDRLMKCVNVLVEAAALRRRNYIIDQTNVFPSAQRRKMRSFEGFKRRAVIVVVSDEEQAKRRAQQEAQDGKDVPDSAILEMKANMMLPRRGEWLEEVSYVELEEDDAKALIQKYNQQGREAGFGPISGQRPMYRDNRGHPYRWDHSTSRRDYRGGGYRDNRSYQNNRYDNRSRQHGGGGGWQNRRPPPGSWNRDIRRDGRRDFRNNRPSGGSRQGERSSSRDNRNRNQSSNSSGGNSGSSYNRNQRSQNNRNQSANWQSGSWQGGQGSWNSQGVWNQGWGGQGSWSGQAQQWKSGYGQGGYGQGGYGNYANWNYYGQYPQQNWNNQGGQPQTTIAGGTPAITDSSSNTTYGQYTTQQAWVQYAQQYAQQGQATTTPSQQQQQQTSTQK